MKLRSKKVLSLLLASAMVFTMNTGVFAETKVLEDVDAAVYAEDANGSTNSQPTTKTNLLKDASVEIAAADKDGNRLATIKNVTNPVSWNKTEQGKALIATVLYGGTDEYLVNDKKKTVSNCGDIKNIVDPGDRSYDVVDLGNENYLFVGYRTNNDYTAFVEGEDDKIPVVFYTGQQVNFDKKGKIFKLDVTTALVEYKDKTVSEKAGGSGVKVKVNNKKKAAVNASVSGTAINTDFEGNCENEKYKRKENVYKLLSGATLPTFTISVKAGKGVDKAVKKAMKELKKKEYKFAIAQKVIFIQNMEGRKETNNTVSYDGELVDYAGNVDLDAATFNDDGIKVTKFKDEKSTLEYHVEDADGKDYKSKLKAGTDYEIAKGTLGGESVIYIKEFKGNFEYYPGQDEVISGYKLAFRQSPVDKKKIRQGVYKADGDGIVYSR